MSWFSARIRVLACVRCLYHMHITPATTEPSPEQRQREEWRAGSGIMPLRSRADHLPCQFGTLADESCCIAL